MKTKCYYCFDWTQDIEGLLKKFKINYKKEKWENIESSVISYPDKLIFEFVDVIWHKKNQELPNAHQMRCTSILPEQAFIFDENCELQKCPTCQKVKYEINHEFRVKIKKEYLDGKLDFYTTPDLFSIGNVSSYTIVSNKVYSLLQKEKMARNLKFEPVVLI